MNEHEGYVVRFRNDLKFKGMDEYVGSGEVGLLTDDINEAWLFDSVDQARTYCDKRLKGVVPKGHMDADFPRVKKHLEVVVDIVRED